MIVDQDEAAVMNAIRCARRQILYFYLQESMPEQIITEMYLLKDHPVEQTCREYIAALEGGDWGSSERENGHRTLVTCPTCADLSQLYRRIDQRICGTSSVENEETTTAVLFVRMIVAF
jgi:hypothetical protein